MRWVSLPAIVASLGVSVAFAEDTRTKPYPGIERLLRKTTTQNINVLIVDLCAPGISLRATKATEKQRTVSAFGALVNAQAAINGDFFSYADYSPTGPAKGGNGTKWGGPDDSFNAPTSFGRYRVAMPGGGGTGGIGDWTREVVSGHPSLVVDNEIREYPSYELCTTRNPRTAIGFNAAKDKLYLAVVDGRATGRAGMTCKELATLMKGLGASDAVNLDGGGSSTMWLAKSGVINFPSDGAQRVVGNHLAVKATGTGNAAHCPNPRFDATYRAHESPIEIVAGEEATMWLEMTNTGDAIWDVDDTRVGTQDPEDRASVFYDDTNWIDPSRPTGADKAGYGPGEIGRFSWRLKAPMVEKSTRFTETFQLVEDGRGFFGPKHTVQIVVHPTTGPTPIEDANPDPNAPAPPDAPVGGGCSSSHSPSSAAWFVFALTAATRSLWRRRRDRACSGDTTRRSDSTVR